MKGSEISVELIIQIAEKLTRMESLKEGMSTEKGLYSATLKYDQVDTSNYCNISYDPITKKVGIYVYIKHKEHAAFYGKVIFLHVSGFEIASRIEIKEDNVITNYITLPHFITLKDSIKKQLQ